jgi:hypothetical protein
MIEFDFIVDGRFRDSLAKDHAEFRTAISGEAWKAALVLVGSIVEALLVDYLLTTTHKKGGGADPLKMHLSELVEACQNEGVITAKTAALSTVVREYRNLIHPGRTVRLGESATKSAAIIAGELLQLIVDEVSASRRAQYGYTAEQIVKKLERDQSAMAIHTHLLREVPEFELERLLLTVIPNRYFELDSAAGDFEPEPDFEGQARLAICFRSAFAAASAETRKKVTMNFLSILKEEDQYKVFTYETAFFSAGDLQYLSPSQAKLVKDHLVSRIQTDISLELLKTFDGLPTFLEASDVAPLVDALLKQCLPKGASALKGAAAKCINQLWLQLPGGEGGLDHLVITRLDDWINHFQKQGLADSAAAVTEIKAELDDIPF